MDQEQYAIMNQVERTHWWYQGMRRNTKTLLRRFLAVRLRLAFLAGRSRFSEVQLTTVLVKWGWASGTVAVLWGAFILAVFLALFNYPTPSGTFTGDRGDAQRVRPSGRDSGQAGKPVKAGDVGGAA